MGDEENQATYLLGRPHPGLPCLWTRGWADGKSLDDVGWCVVCDTHSSAILSICGYCAPGSLSPALGTVTTRRQWGTLESAC